jgi:hypothetical protein
MCLWWEGISAFFRDGRFGIGVGHRDHGDERESFDRVRVRMSLLPPRDRRTTRLLFVRWQRRCAFSTWTWTSWLNARHMAFAWCSLVWVAVTDLYIYLLSTGTIRDINTW